MFYKLLFLFNVVVFINIHGQKLHHNPFSLYDEVPTSKLRIRGIGNSGFDSDFNIYNPKYDPDVKQLKISAFLNSNIASSRIFTAKYFNPDIEVNNTENKFKVKPGISLQYNFENFGINLSYLNSLLFNRQLFGFGPYEVDFYKGGGRYPLYFSKPELEITNDIVQLSFSGKLGENFSISGGIASNSYTYNIKLNAENAEGSYLSKYEFELKDKVFSHFQYILSINYVEKRTIDWYILIKSELPSVNLLPEEIDINNISFLNEGEITFPGTIGYGLQVKINSPLKISAEVEHDLTRGISNTELILGANYKAWENIEFGLSASYYLDYHDEIYMYPDGITRDWTGGLEMKNPFSFIFSSAFMYNNIKILGSYQVTGVKYSHSEESSFDYSHYLLLGISYSLNI